MHRNTFHHGSHQRSSIVKTAIEQLKEFAFPTRNHRAIVKVTIAGERMNKQRDARHADRHVPNQIKFSHFPVST
jgi:hypothetical protein